MSEDDRAAKAARAKAMVRGLILQTWYGLSIIVIPKSIIQLKKRQQKKAAEYGGPISDVTSVPSRTSTPASSEPVAGDQKCDDVDDVYVFLHADTFRLVVIR